MINTARAQKTSNPNTPDTLTQQKKEFRLFIADSTIGNYYAALAHLQHYKQLKDSSFNVLKQQQVDSLNKKFETEKKDADLQLKDQEIQHLSLEEKIQALGLIQQRLAFQVEAEKKKQRLSALALAADNKEAELKMDSLVTRDKDKSIQYQSNKIALLNKDSQLQTARLRQNQVWRNLFLGGAIALLLALGLVYARYRSKQKSNRLLQAQQEEINRSNDALKIMNERQRKLLSEKEWLVHEIHHRVKSNLQIVRNLLDMQTASLKDENALNAFGDISHRVYAISLIHQKLHQLNDMTVIDMPDYIHELTNYLKDSFTDKHKIEFHIDVDNISLDVAQSVPLGLILNEAITNAYKYAFDGKQSGLISILLREEPSPENTARPTIRLTISDNGAGLPGNFSGPSDDSLGFQLMETLGEQLDGRLSYYNNPGCTIDIAFQCQQAFYSHNSLMPIA